MSRSRQLLLSVAVVAVLFAVSSVVLYYIAVNFPALTPADIASLNLPTLSVSDPVHVVQSVIGWIRNLDNVKALGIVLTNYSANYYYQIMIAYVATYIFLQSFAIPGSASLSLLGGALFGFNVGMLLVCTCSAIGALNCYLLSYLVGSPFVEEFKDSPRIKYLRDQVDKQRGSLLSYILFLRITPLLPNWFINITSPHANIPAHLFFIGTFFGVIPLSMIPVNAGLALQSLTSFDDFSIWNPKTLAMIFATGFAAFIPTVATKYLGGRYSVGEVPTQKEAEGQKGRKSKKED